MKKIIKKLAQRLTFIAIVIVILGAPLAYLTILNSPTAKAAWFDDNWAYRKAVNIATHTAAENNVYINLTGANDIDTSDTGRFQTDCGDLRFTDAGGKLLQYYVVSGCSSADTVVHVFFGTMSAGAQTVYYYYGNPTVQNGGNSADFATEASSYTFTTIGSEEKTPGPIAYWKFDDGTGTNAQDSTTNNNDGTVSGATWQTEDQCVAGKCLWFDGSNDYVYTADNAILDNASSALTVGAWIKPNSYDSSNWDIIATKWKDGAPASYSWHFSLHQGKLSIFISSDGTTAGSELAVDSSVIETNKWSYVVFTVDTATDEVKLYKNGIQVGSTGTYTASSIPNSSAQLRIGTKEGANEGSFPFPGFIDDVKIYPYARSAAQIKTDYNSRGSTKGTSTNLSNPVIPGSTGNLSNGLVGYWKMDESSGNAVDSSGNSSILTNTNTATFTTGKFGNAGTFASASNQYFTVTDNATLSTGDIDFTIAAWVYLDSIPTAGKYPVIAGKKNVTNSREYILFSNGDQSGKFYIQTYQSGGGVLDYQAATNFGNPSTGTWYFVVAYHDSVNDKLGISVNAGTPNIMTTTGTIVDSTSSFTIGGDTAISGAWNGRIDESRVYKRVLSPADITALYNFAPGPRVHLKMDENSGTAANDSSGNARTGTINGNPVWAPGKYGAGVKMDGTGDDIQISDF